MRISWQLDVVQNLARVASCPDDDGETRLNKTLAVILWSLMAPLGALKMAAWRVVGPARSEAISGGEAMGGEPTPGSNQELA